MEILKCHGADCDIKEACYRYTAKKESIVRDKNQPFIVHFQKKSRVGDFKFIDGNCEDFITNCRKDVTGL